jgi:GDP-L-fucose synthase
VDLHARTVIVTGGTGFFGSYVVRELERAGATVVPVGRASYDLLVASEIVRMLEEHEPDALVHLAGTVGGIGANEREPGRFLYENALMGLQVLDQSRVHGVEKALVIGTVCSYPSEAPVPFREEDIWHGFPEETNAPYGVAKRLLLTQAQAYREQYGMNAIYLIPANLYGPGDNFDLADGHVIPAMIHRFVEARASGTDRVALWGDGSPTREFLHVADAARACRLALERYDGAEPVNVGSGQEISIRDLARRVAESVGFEGEIVWDAAKPNGQRRRKLDVSRAKRLFGFEAEVDLAAGLAETVEWYQRVVGVDGGRVQRGR